MRLKTGIGELGLNNESSRRTIPYVLQVCAADRVLCVSDLELHSTRDALQSVVAGRRSSVAAIEDDGLQSHSVGLGLVKKQGAQYNVVSFGVRQTLKERAENDVGDNANDRVAFNASIVWGKTLNTFTRRRPSHRLMKCAPMASVVDEDRIIVTDVIVRAETNESADDVPCRRLRVL